MIGQSNWCLTNIINEKKKRNHFRVCVEVCRIYRINGHDCMRHSHHQYSELKEEERKWKGENIETFV